MPQIGLCTDLTCDKEAKQLYECHCCFRLICINHLIEHINRDKQNKERLNCLNNELIIVISALKLIVEKKLLTIEYEKELIERGNELLNNVENHSIDEIENIFQKMNQAIVSNHSEESIVKVEPSLSNIKNCSCICKCNNEKLYKQSNTSVSFDLTNDTDETNTSIMTKDNEHPSYVDDQSNDNILLDETEDIMTDEDATKITASRYFLGFCPLTFDGAYGLTQAKHSIRLCSKNKIRQVGLLGHFKNQHRLKDNCARRLIRAIQDKKDPITTKIFDENEDVIDHFYTVPCPFNNNGIAYLSGYDTKRIQKIPCQRRSIKLYSLEFHFKRYHKLPYDLARRLAVQTKHDIKSVNMVMKSNKKKTNNKIVENRFD